MDTDVLRATAAQLVAPGRGILAADESTGTIKKRFDSIGLDSTEDNRRAYRQMLFTTPGLAEHISGVILFDETIRQSATDGPPFAELLATLGIIPGIKVDTGAKPLAMFPGETVTEGLDGLRERLAHYRELGARFAKWRATIFIGDDIPTDFAILANAHAMARYAALCQEAGVVPIVEPEILMDGDHSIEACGSANGRTLRALYAQLAEHRVDLAGSLLKVNMVLSGTGAATQAGPSEVAEATIRVLRAARACGRRRRRLPVRRPVRCRFHRSPQRDEPICAASVAALVLVRARVAGPVAQGVGRRSRQGAGRPASARPPGADERAGADGGLFGGSGVLRGVGAARTRPRIAARRSADDADVSAHRADLQLQVRRSRPPTRPTCPARSRCRPTSS